MRGRLTRAGKVAQVKREILALGAAFFVTPQNTIDIARKIMRANTIACEALRALVADGKLVHVRGGYAWPAPLP